MTDTSIDDVEISGPQELPQAEDAAAQIVQGLRDIERERSRIPQADWDTLFRQLQTAMTSLATHPFVVGDPEAERLMNDVMLAGSLQEMDEVIDLFADYAIRKIQFNLQLRAAAGEEIEDTSGAILQGHSTSRATRAASSYGPSGSDFEIMGEQDTPNTQKSTAGSSASRRGNLRL